MTRLQFLDSRDGARLAYRHLAERGPTERGPTERGPTERGPTGTRVGILFCPGFHSNMQGDKALALEAWCRQAGRQFTRFDYFGHGESGGAIEKGRIGRWADDTTRVLDEVTSGPQLVVGSSMGGWLMLLATLARPARVAALLGIASAPDFTRVMRERLGAGEAALQMREKGYYDMPSHYPGESTYRIEQSFLDEAETHCLLDGAIPIDVPVRLLHGQADVDVPWQRSLMLSERLTTRDLELCLVKDGDHQLSRPSDLRRMLRVVESLCLHIEANER